MSAKKRLIRNIIIAVVGIALLGGAYIFALKWEPSADSGEKPEDIDTELTYIVSESEEDISSVHIKNSAGEYDIIKGESESGESFYTIPSVTENDIDSAKLKAAVSGLVHLTAERTISADVSKAGEFGFDGSEISFTIFKNDGSEIRVLMGSETPDGGEYYCMIENGDAIYTISSYKYEIAAASSDYYREMSILTVTDISNISQLSLYKGDSPVLKIRHTTDEENSTKIMETGWTMEYPWQAELTNDKTSAMLQSLAVIGATGFSKGDAPSAYEYRLEVTAGDTDYSFEIGGKSQNGDTYLKDNNTGIVYMVGGELLSFLDGISPNDYISKFVCLYNIAEVSRVTVSWGDTNYEMEVGDDKGKPYIINGETVEEDAFEDIYQTIIALTFTDIKEYSPSGDPYMTITFEFSDGTDETISFYDANEREYAALRSDGLSVRLLKSELTKITDLMSK